MSLWKGCSVYIIGADAGNVGIDGHSAQQPSLDCSSALVVHCKLFHMAAKENAAGPRPSQRPRSRRCGALAPDPTTLKESCLQCLLVVFFYLPSLRHHRRHASPDLLPQRAHADCCFCSLLLMGWDSAHLEVQAFEHWAEGQLAAAAGTRKFAWDENARKNCLNFRCPGASRRASISGASYATAMVAVCT